MGWPQVDATAATDQAIHDPVVVQPEAGVQPELAEVIQADEQSRVEQPDALESTPATDQPSSEAEIELPIGESQATQDAQPAIASQSSVDPGPSPYVSTQVCSEGRLNTRSANCWDMITETLRGPHMRVLPSGTFIMGDDDLEHAAPAREVAVVTPFAISIREITVAEYSQFCAQSAAHPCCGNASRARS